MMDWKNVPTTPKESIVAAPGCMNLSSVNFISRMTPYWIAFRPPAFGVM